MNYLIGSEDCEVADGAPPQRSNRLRQWVRRVSAWAWEEERRRSEQLGGYKRIATLLELRLGMLEELFRAKQDKITRLQAAYNAKKRPLYEDMRQENLIKDAESLAQSISVLAQRAESYRARTGLQMRVSDGTVLGVPGDKPNVEYGDGWDASQR